VDGFIDPLGALGRREPRGQLEPVLNMVPQERHESGQRKTRIFRGFHPHRLRNLCGTCKANDAGRADYRCLQIAGSRDAGTAWRTADIAPRQLRSE
jgi:hypothetical protein